MLGQLPESLNVNGTDYAIRSDYRNILRIFSVFNAPDLSDAEKALLFLRRMYVNFEAIPAGDYAAAYEAATQFIECNPAPEKKQPRIVDWEKDEQLMFAAVNKVAGMEIRAVEKMHWWTFMGYFQGIDKDDTWGVVLTIRQKKAKHRKLEKYETEFFNANRAMCELKETTDRKKEAVDFAQKLYEQLLKE